MKNSVEGIYKCFYLKKLLGFFWGLCAERTSFSFLWPPEKVYSPQVPDVWSLFLNGDLNKQTQTHLFSFLTSNIQCSLTRPDPIFTNTKATRVKP